MEAYFPFSSLHFFLPLLSPTPLNKYSYNAAFVCMFEPLQNDLLKLSSQSDGCVKQSLLMMGSLVKEREIFPLPVYGVTVRPLKKKQDFTN